MKHPVYRGSNGLLHGSTTRDNGWLRIACETRGGYYVALETFTRSSNTVVTCVQCLAVLVERD